MPIASFEGADEAALARFKHVLGDLEEEEDVAVGHAEDDDENRGDVQDAQGFEDVCPWGREDEQEREGSSGFDACDQVGGAAQPCAADGPVEYGEVKDWGARGDKERWDGDCASEEEGSDPYACGDGADGDVRAEGEGEGADEKADDDEEGVREGSSANECEQANDFDSRVKALEQAVGVSEVFGVEGVFHGFCKATDGALNEGFAAATSVMRCGGGGGAHGQDVLGCVVGDFSSRR